MLYSIRYFQLSSGAGHLTRPHTHCTQVTTYMPRQHRGGRSAPQRERSTLLALPTWAQDLVGTLPTPDPTIAFTDHQDVITILRWIAQCLEENTLLPGERVTVRGNRNVSELQSESVQPQPRERTRSPRGLSPQRRPRRQRSPTPPSR